jgi:glycosyltransferase involved in cell wall biosynthesis
MISNESSRRAAETARGAGMQVTSCERNNPLVSIILPTFNRADVLLRAIDSVRNQTYPEWELVVVDDGSTDGTEALVRSLPDRVLYLRQENAGCYVARNLGLRHAKGELITFLDSDDEWLPHYLELMVAFVVAHEQEHFVMAEFWSDSGFGSPIRNDLDLFAYRWPRMARRIGSRELDLPAGETDPYMRVFSAREGVGAWGREIAQRAGYPEASVYRGNIHRAYRWGYIGWLPTTLITRHALDVVGYFRDDVRTAADYAFLIKLSKHFPAAVIGVPSAIKYEKGHGGSELAEAHLATGRNEYRYAVTRIGLLEDAFGDQLATDPELPKIHGLFHLYAGRTALELGMPAKARDHLNRTRRVLPDLAEVPRLLWFARLVPWGGLSKRLYRGWLRLKDLVNSVQTGDLTLAKLVARVRRRLLR